MQQNNIYDGLEYTTKEVNGNFKIWVYGYDHNGKRIDTIVGVSGLIRFCGVEKANKFIKRAFETYDSDKCVCKLYRGLKITFYTN